MNTLFNAQDLNEIISKVMRVDVKAWRDLVDVRGMKPVKAAIRLGAEPNMAQLVGDLKLAITAEDINRVYADDRCLSCMVGKKVGEFYSINKVGVIYAPNFRVLVGLTTGVLNPKPYGFKGWAVFNLFCSYFEQGSIFPKIHFQEESNVLVKKVAHKGVKVIRTTYLPGTTSLNGVRANLYKSPELYKEVFNLVKKDIQEQLEGKHKKSRIYSKSNDISTEFFIHSREEKCYGEINIKNLLKCRGLGGVGTYIVDEEDSIVRYDVELFTEYRKVYRKKKVVKFGRKIIEKEGISTPYLDEDAYDQEGILDDLYIKDMTHVAENHEEFLEDHYWNLLGDSYREGLYKPRTKYKNLGE